MKPQSPRLFGGKLFLSATLLIFSINSACAQKIVRVEFTSTPLPAEFTILEEAFTQSAIRLTYDDKSVKVIPLNYNVLFRSGDKVGTNRAGAILDIKGIPISNWGQTTNHFQIRKGPIFSSSPDGNTLISLKKKESSGSHSLYLITHFENHSWVENADRNIHPLNAKYDVPMTINLTNLQQNIKNGNLIPKSLQPVDASASEGFWFPCAASLTPWNTHLGSEEYEPNAQWFENAPLETVNLFLGTTGKKVKEGGANPYRYGFPIEIQLEPEGIAKVNKRYAMGRISLELGVVMPDERTVYLTDDAKDGVRLLFIADQPRDLSSGTLYAAKWHQTRTKEGDSANLSWIKLGHSDEKSIQAYLDQRITFSDIFTRNTIPLTSATSDSFHPAYVFQGYTPKIKNSKNEPGILDPKIEFLQIKPGMATAAAFLETRRFAALQGATTEFTKLEGQALNKKRKKLYTAVSKAYEGMLAGKNGPRFQDDIQLVGLPDDLLCGIVYESDLKGDQLDSKGNPVLSDWVATNMKALIKGKSAGPGSCDVNHIANPDNLKFSEMFQTLFIAEDSGVRHPRDMLWAYSVETGTLSRILMAPKHSEISGLFVAEDTNGFAYLFANFQRSIYPEDFAETMKPEEANKLVAEKDLRGLVGYLGPIPIGSK